MFTFLIGCVLVTVFLVNEFYVKRKGLPPGPMPLPFVGNTLSLGIEPPGYAAFLRWRKTYGPVYTFWLGTDATVCLSDWASIKESVIDKGELFVERKTLEDLVYIIRGGYYGIVEAQGALWREQRRFAMHMLKDFGMGRNLMQERILDEVVYMVEKLRNLSQDESAGYDIQGDLDLAIGSVINGLLFGYRFEDSNVHEFAILKQMLQNHMQQVIQPLTTVAMAQPHTLGRLPILKTKLNKVVNNMQKIFDYLEGQISTRKEIFDGCSKPTNFCDAFLKEMSDRGGEDASKHNFSHRQLRNACLDLWVAGLESTTTTLSFAILYSIRHPECAALARAELDEVIGCDRLVTLDDKISLPYVNAFLAETQRLLNLLPMNLMRVASEDITIQGHLIRKGTTVIPQISCLLYDENVFPNPMKFNPNHFLTPDGKFKKVDEWNPFSVGKRQCLGISLAKTELFLIVANLLNQFEFEAVDTNVMPSDEKTAGFAVQQKPYRCKIKARH
uniref:Cytochrome P450 n=1 Tax=Panagrellus redivivus TaxID=6233 RepID=A0A7E4V6Z0_PANRE